MKSQEANRIVELFCRFSYSPAITRKVHRWLIEPEGEAEKDEALRRVWDSIAEEAAPELAHSWASVKMKAGIKSQRFYLRPRLLRRVACVLLPFAIAFAGYRIFFNEPHMTVVVTQNSEHRYVLLPDQSEVWLNSGSRISYPEGFKDSVRQVTLSGEAYFRVAKDKAKPFIVRTEDMNIRALGTEFNVQAYPADSRSVATLSSGKIQVEVAADGEGEESFLLAPRQQVVYNKERRQAVMNTVEEAAAAWKAGQLIFSEATLPDMVNELQRRFDVTIDYRALGASADLYTVKFTDNENITQVLEVLQDVVGFQYVRESARRYRMVKRLKAKS